MTNASLEVSFAPYASPNSVIDLIHRLRDAGLPDPLTLDGLGLVGVSPSMVSPTLRSFKFLGIVDDDGQKLPAYQRLSVATSEEYPGVLADVVKSAYSDVFNIVDPGKHDADQVEDAFRQYIPQKQRRRMVRLFLGLCAEAGLAPEQPKRRRGQGTVRSTTRPTETVHPDRQPNVPQDPPPVASAPNNATEVLVGSFVAQLPDSGEWTRDHRERWLRAVESAVDLMIAVSDSDEGFE